MRAARYRLWVFVKIQKLDENFCENFATLP